MIKVGSKTYMSKSSIYTSVIIASYLLVPALVFAQNGVQVNTILNNVTTAARLLVTLLFVLAMLVFVWGAVKLITAAGDPEAIKKARGFMWWGVIAMAVLASVFGLVTFLQSYFGVTGGGGFQNVPIPANIIGN